MHEHITGIQQIGIGVSDAQEAMRLYKDLFGMSVLIFDDVAEASLMKKYTGGQSHNRRAVLTMNMAGGGGFELWQFQDRKPIPAALPTSLGDIGINAAKIKCADVASARAHFSKMKGVETSMITADPTGEGRFMVHDQYDQVFEVVGSGSWFLKGETPTGGIIGAVIGVREMERSVTFFSRLLGECVILYDHTSVRIDLKGNSCLCRSVLLRKVMGRQGAFHRLLGDIEIELVQCLDRIPDTIYKDRFWGDLGFIHLCLDVLRMDKLKQHMQQYGYNFSMDSNDSFAMDAASGRFCYLEDPDGTLIELVETHRVPIFKKFGLYLNLKTRNIERPLPDWMIKLLALSKVK